MKDYFYVVTVTCETQEQADEAIIERISPDEDYGFEYGIDWKTYHDDPSVCPACGEELLVYDRGVYCVNDWRHG